jgi:2'-5' RNA ligase
MLIDIAILPPQDTRKKIGAKMKKGVGDLPNLFVVDNDKLIPHLSLWHLRTSKEKINKIAREVEKIAKGQKSVKINSSTFHALEQYKGFLEFAVKNTKELALLQQKVFQKTYLYKTGTMPKFASFVGHPYTGEKLKEVKKYGRPLGFTPHFTMGWLKNEKDVAPTVKKMQGIKLSFLAKELYICEVDKWWQVKRIIKKIEF